MMSLVCGKCFTLEYRIDTMVYKYGSCSVAPVSSFVFLSVILESLSLCSHCSSSSSSAFTSAFSVCVCVCVCDLRSRRTTQSHRERVRVMMLSAVALLLVCLQMRVLGKPWSQSAGCDDLLGSGRVPDKCGVCGGDNSACKLVSGLFQHSLTKVGYHKIVEIPPGATKINVTEMVKSRNYLALLSRSGRSIINGNWAIDRPGMYEGVGTMFMYRRPNEISSTAGESFLAEGPTNEILDVFMIYQQPNPGVRYEFIMPSENAVDAPHPKQNQLDGQSIHVVLIFP
uniref:Thrombospondin type 1 domain containing 4 n=1 Tax=Cyprinus carpio TaxID=7962 RepID=A0A8C2IPS7_CYPCA